ncbi:MAG: aminopeptidase P family protein [Prevotellaceae bacterium]|jgi:Xaa-Pro aminopeptidase|nr:aminopeptidase P family protein [Prevotellaceae bacterium]
MNENLNSIRTLMLQKGLAAVIVPSTDPHNSEYVAPHWQARQWLSEFSGSAGTLAITLNKAGLWTDSRYFLQAKEQLQMDIRLFKDGLEDTPNIVDWLCSELTQDDIVSVNATLFSINEIEKIEKQLNEKGIKLNTQEDLIAPIWQNRPKLPQGKVLDFTFSGLSAGDKIENLRKEMSDLQIDTLVLSALDQIAWLMNIRGNDVEYNPVVISYAMINKSDVYLFADENKFDNELKTSLHKKRVTLLPYGSIFENMKNMKECVVGLDFNAVNYAIFNSVSKSCTIKNCISPIIRAKSIKNKIEISGFRKAMVNDGVALVKFFRWLEKSVPNGEVTELKTSEMLHRFRSEQKGFVSESFETIAAYAQHGAIVHYEPTKESDVKLQPKGLFLLDSGGQYLDGTTDITRTVALGRVSRQEKTDFANVLKGHIALSRATFPCGTRGTQLDVLARQFLWQNLQNFGHGTGHGVGHFLCVHEGPQSIRMNENPTPLLPGMVISNEPGIYRAGKWGIRCENLILVNEVKRIKNNSFGTFYNFETLTLFPFDKKLIANKLFTKEEKKWLNNYHSTVYKRLSPFLNKAEKNWLKSKCRQL